MTGSVAPLPAAVWTELLEISLCSMFLLWTVGMTNVGSLVAPERILRDVRSMIADPL